MPAVIFCKRLQIIHQIFGYIQKVDKNCLYGRQADRQTEKVLYIRACYLKMTLSLSNITFCSKHIEFEVNIRPLSIIWRPNNKKPNNVRGESNQKYFGEVVLSANYVPSRYPPFTTTTNGIYYYI